MYIRTGPNRITAIPPPNDADDPRRRDLDVGLGSSESDQWGGGKAVVSGLLSRFRLATLN
jgi:hypothetical protein